MLVLFWSYSIILIFSSNTCMVLKNVYILIHLEFILGCNLEGRSSFSPQVAAQLSLYHLCNCSRFPQWIWVGFWSNIFFVGCFVNVPAVPHSFDFWGLVTHFHFDRTRSLLSLFKSFSDSFCELVLKMIFYWDHINVYNLI